MGCATSQIQTALKAKSESNLEINLGFIAMFLLLLSFEP